MSASPQTYKNHQKFVPINHYVLLPLLLVNFLAMRELLPQDLQARINDFTPEQFIGLRFASDAELPGLAAAMLRDNIQKRDAIKKMVKNWRADTLRV